MFEESLVESQVTRISATKRWTMLGSTALQAAVAATLIILPLLHPERLAFHVETPLVFTPPPPRPPLPVAQTQHTSSTSSAPSLPGASRPLIRLLLPSSSQGTDDPPVIGTGTVPMADNSSNLLSAWGGHSVAVHVAPAAAPAKPRHVSEGVAAGRLITPIRPSYPAIAKAAGVSGTVIVEAIIAKSGSIESLHVVSGPEMLRAAAIDAIRSARYQPFRLNGEPTEVQTTITVNFKMGG